MLYNTLALPYFNYGVTIWGHSYAKNISKIVRIQKKIVRIITFSAYLEHTENLFKSHNILKFKSLYDYFTLIFMYNYKHGMLPSSFDTFFIPNNHIHKYQTRNAIKYRTKYCSSLITSFSIQKMGPSIWNALPNTVKESKSLSIFKRRLKLHLIESQ